jgi:AcrR family transcriptional regulator
MARERIFDIDQATDVAMKLFWRNGYELTSLADLTQAMGITPPSFYFAFKSKEGLFERVLDHYWKTRLLYAEEALTQPTARSAVEMMLYRLADLYTDPGYPPGCLAMNCALPCADSTVPIRQKLSTLRAGRRARLLKRLEQAQAMGDLPADEDTDALCRFVLAMGWGLAVDAQSGATRDDLRRTVSTALRGWPV